MKLVCDFLLTEGTTWEDLSTSEKKLFEKVVPVIMDRRRGLEEADSLRRANAINQSSIAAAVNVSRKTLCTNNRIVANFIEKYSSGEQKTDVKAERYAHLQAELAEVRGRLDKVLDQEIIAQNYAAELHLAEDRINQKDIQIHRSQGPGHGSAAVCTHCL